MTTVSLEEGVVFRIRSGGDFYACGGATNWFTTETEAKETVDYYRSWSEPEWSGADYEVVEIPLCELTDAELRQAIDAGAL